MFWNMDLTNRMPAMFRSQPQTEPYIPALDFAFAVDLAAGCVSINPQLSMPANLATSNHEQSFAVVATYTITIQPPNHGSDHNTLA